MIVITSETGNDEFLKPSHLNRGPGSIINVYRQICM